MADKDFLSPKASSISIPSGELTASAHTGLAARFTMTQLTWQPAAGERWSILECLDHIAISADTVYLDAMQTAIGDARSGPQAGVLHTAGLPWA